MFAYLRGYNAIWLRRLKLKKKTDKKISSKLIGSFTWTGFVGQPGPFVNTVQNGLMLQGSSKTVDKRKQNQSFQHVKISICKWNISL